MANFSAVVTARRAMLPEDFLDGVIYATDQVHASITKAAALAGFPKRSVHVVDTDPEHRMDVDALRAMVRDDRANGLKPFMVVASAGTTNTGTVDPIADIADVAELENLWFHVDGAYGGAFQMTERGREHFRGIERASSARDKLSWLITYAETLRALTHHAAERCKVIGGVAVPYALLVNIAKLQFAPDAAE